MALADVTAASLVEVRLAMEAIDLLSGVPSDVVDDMRSKWLRDLVEYQDVPQAVADETDDRPKTIDAAYKIRYEDQGA